MKANQNRIQQHIELLSQFTATPGQGVTRLTYSQEDLLARNYIKERMVEYGLTVTEDGFGNIFGKLEGQMPDKPSVLVGSHFDSVPNGGAYDGTAGVVVGLELAALFKENAITPLYPLEIIAFVEEEGSRFGGALMGSRGMMGVLTESDFNQLSDAEGVLAKDAMLAIGLDPSKKKVRDPKTILAFLELHIEQGPILEDKGIQVGIVEGIVGLTQLEVTVQGRAGHAGTTPMDRRSDALVSAARIVGDLPEIANAVGNGTVITTGRLNVFPNGSNVIPENVIFTVDIRSGEEEHVLEAVERTKERIMIQKDEGIQITVKEQMSIQPKLLDVSIRSVLKESSDLLGASNCSIHSGAGHDAMVLSDYTACGMLFIPSKDGLSHCPEEWSDAFDLAAGTNILFETVNKLMKEKSS
ncbi:Zn-dependent hydrolase [Sporosarcina ureilytica]|uniref:Zn-dependent hydrolase n=1 Tax=Sporosarcina ureilytica TaxID=298596 RepID=A0A1D8JCN8_9BACL|nr:Zn-dependent hydrolase [Sporosarcina ureilytica]AOV06478.1 Zn-dependent hydrolase [Sporosarcina ureilytica]